MKRLLILPFFLVLSMLTFSQYDYPYKNPNVATIFGSSSLMLDNVSQNIPTQEYSITLPWAKPVPEAYWYNKGFKFSLVPQKQKAPLIFVLAGTGAAHNSVRNQLLQRIFYDAGYSVISISSPMNQNFIINGSSDRMPGIIYDDSVDIYNIMKEIYNKVKDKVKVSEFYLTGYSLGATESAMVAYIDDQEKVFNFKRVFMINPAVDAYDSAVRLDNFLNFPPNERAEKIAALIQRIMNQIVAGAIPDYTVIDIETIYSIFSRTLMSNREMQEIIGGAFRLTSIDLNYISDTINNMGVYGCTPAGKFTPMFSNFEKINFATFEDYVNKVAFPYFQKHSDKPIVLEDLLKKSRLNYIQDYLKNSKKIAVVTNADELILNEKEINYLKDTFKGRIIVYPYGGHCGNMFYTTNVKNMLNFFKEGELKNEN